MQKEKDRKSIVSFHHFDIINTLLSSRKRYGEPRDT